MKQASKNTFSDDNTLFYGRDRKKVKQQVNNKPIIKSHEGTKSRRDHEEYSSVFILFRVPLCHRGFAVKKQMASIFGHMFSNGSIRANYLLRFYSLFFLLLFPLLLPAQSSQFFVQQGLIHYELQEYDKAIHNFQMALLYPNPQREVFMYITSSHLLNQDYEQAVRSADEGLDEHPGFIRLKVMKGEALIQTDKKKAVALFEEVWEEMKQANVEQEDDVQQAAIGHYISRIYQQMAAEAFEHDDLQTAARHFENAKYVDPDEINIQNNLVFILIQLEEWERADRSVKNALRKFPDSENLLLMQAQIYEQQENSGELLNTLEHLYQTDPSNMNRAVMYGRALLSANRANEANTFFREKLDRYPEERVLYETLLDINRQRFNQTGILEVLRLQMHQFPNDMELEEEYGLELISARKYQEANAWFDSLAVVYDEPEFGRLAAQSWLFDEDYEQAETEYRRQLERWPDHVVMKGEFGRVLIRNKKANEAKDILRPVLEISEDEYLRYGYARLLEAKSEREIVLEPLQETMYSGRAQWLLFNHSDEYWRKVANAAELSEILIGMLEFVENRQKTVQAEAQTGLETLRAPLPPLFQTATELNEAGDEIRELLETARKRLAFDVSSAIVNNALSVYPESALLLYHKGVLYYEHNKPEQAKEFLLEAAELEANQQKTHFVLGQIYNELNQFEQAVLSFERVLTLNPENRQAYRSLIRIHQQNGQMEQLSSRWLQRYQHQKRNDVLKEFVVEALHRANRFEEAREVLD